MSRLYSFLEWYMNVASFGVIVIQFVSGVLSLTALVVFIEYVIKGCECSSVVQGTVGLVSLVVSFIGFMLVNLAGASRRE